MIFHYAANQILQMAEQIERNGARFYRKAAEVVQDEKIGKVLLDFATWEEGDGIVFASMRKNPTELERQPTFFHSEGDASLYLRAMAAGHLFVLKRDPAAVLTNR
jgi:rubrerythrin